MKKVLFISASVLMLGLVIVYALFPKDMERTFVSLVNMVKGDVSSVSVIETNTSSEDMIEGEWTFECDVLEFNDYTWKSNLSFNHAQMVVEISFDDWDIGNDNQTLAFIISSPDPNYQYDWLYTKVDGSLYPELTYFNESDFMDSYPGGYPAFEQELKAMGIDWENMFLRANAEFLLLYLTYEHPCAPKQQIDSQST